MHWKNNGTGGGGFAPEDCSSPGLERLPDPEDCSSPGLERLPDTFGACEQRERPTGLAVRRLLGYANEEVNPGRDATPAPPVIHPTQEV
jgi:hypothetical protein